MADEGRDDIPQRTLACRVCGWETWDDECWECAKRERHANRYGALGDHGGTGFGA